MTTRSLHACPVQTETDGLTIQGCVIPSGAEFQAKRGIWREPLNLSRVNLSDAWLAAK
jgi:hypothetical protein